MPYIKADRRKQLDNLIDRLIDKDLSPGDFNYIMYRLAINQGEMANNYGSWRGAIGDMICSAMELYRRKVAPYEDSKIAENGDIL